MLGFLILLGLGLVIAKGFGVEPFTEAPWWVITLPWSVTGVLTVIGLVVLALGKRMIDKH